MLNARGDGTEAAWEGWLLSRWQAAAGEGTLGTLGHVLSTRSVDLVSLFQQRKVQEGSGFYVNLLFLGPALLQEMLALVLEV